MARRTVLSPDLKERHVSMMAFSACVGFGLFLQSGNVTYLGGPGQAVLAFLIACSIMWAIIGCLGEMTSLWPIPGPLFEFPGRFLDEGVGYATGWTSWFAWTVTMAAEIMTIGQLWCFGFHENYLRDVGYPDQTLAWNTDGNSPAVWVFIFLIIILVTNFLPIRYYGELEYIFGCAKILFITGLIMFNVILSALQRVPHDSNFWTWSAPWGFSSSSFVLSVDDKYRPVDTLEGDPGHFVSLWTAVTTVIFSLIGFETIALTAPENKDLEKFETIKLATKKLTLRITLLYTLAVFTAGLNVEYDDPYLREAAWSSIHGGQNSMFIIAAVKNRLRVWPSFFNGFFIFSACTSGINALYNSSRLLHAMASIPEAWPLWGQAFRRRLERTTSAGVPLATIIASWLIGLLAFLSVKSFPSKVLGRMATNATVSELLTYTVICASYVRFYHCIKKAADNHTLENRSAFNRDDEQYPYRTRGQLFRATYGLVFCALLILFNGWRSFLAPFSTPDFIVSYIGPVAFCVLVAAYHVKSDGWRPWRWRWSASMQIQRPPPKVVVPGRRRGKLEFPDRKTLWTMDNFRAFVDWVWVWVK